METAELSFWGEWEAASSVQALPGSVPNAPHWSHHPLYANPAGFDDPQNTDPFVFGAFLYTGCRQLARLPHGRGWRSTTMQHLAPGSLILFGSKAGVEFVLDTVLVVATHVDHCADNYTQILQGLVPDAYWDVTLHRWYPREGWFRLYFGKSADGASAKPFSFVPVRTSTLAPSGFSRPVLKPIGPLRDIIRPNSYRTFHRTFVPNGEAVLAVWNSVVNQVLDQACDLGLGIDAVPWPTTRLESP